VGLLLVTWHARAATVHADFALAVPPAAPSNAELARARESFHSGLSDADAGRWPQAVLAFEEAYRRSGNPVALLNMATALRESGRAADARSCAVALRTRHQAQLDAETLAKVDELYAGVTAVIALREVPPDALVFIDGAIQTRDARRFELDPGMHRVEVREPGRLPFQWQDVVAAHQTRELEYRASPASEPSTADQPNVGSVREASTRESRVRQDAGGRKRRLPRWALAMIIGGAAFAAGVAVAVPLTLRDRGMDAPSGVDMTYELQ
jgi:hypothetical protein